MRFFATLRMTGGEGLAMTKKGLAMTPSVIARSDSGCEA